MATLPGVGGERASRLTKLGIRTVGDLLWHGPRRYEDRNQPHEVKGLAKGDDATVAGTIVAAGVKRMRFGKSLFEFILDDGTARLHCRWWNMPYMERYHKTGDFVHVHGKIKGRNRAQWITPRRRYPRRARSSSTSSVSCRCTG